MGVGADKRSMNRFGFGWLSLPRFPWIAGLLFLGLFGIAGHVLFLMVRPFLLRLPALPLIWTSTQVSDYVRLFSCMYALRVIIERV